MADKLQLMLEAERRGILPPDRKAMLDEARKRGLVQATPQQQAETDVREGKDPDYRKSGMLPAGLQRFSDAMTDPLGLQDEMVGAGQYIRSLVTGNKGLVNPETWSDASKAYSDAAERVRAERRVSRQDYSIVPEIIGGLGTAGAAQGFRMAPTLGGRVAQSAKTGAGFGLVAGVAQGEGGIPERIVSGAEGAATGAVLGPLVTEVAAPIIGGVVRAAKAGGRGVSNAVQVLRSRNANVDQRMARALEDQNMSPAQGLNYLDEVDNASRFRQTQLDPRFTLADLGPSTRDLADTASLVSREARGAAGEFLSDRGRGQFGRMNDYLRRSLQVTRDEFAATQSRLLDEQRTLSRQAYDQFRNADVQIDVGRALYNRQLDDLAAAPELKSVLARAREQFVAARGKRDLSEGARNATTGQIRQLRQEHAEAMDRLRGLRRQRQDATSPQEKRALLSAIRDHEDTVVALSREMQSRRRDMPGRVISEQAYTSLTPARFDSGKRAVDDMIEAAQRGGRNNEVRLLTQLKNELVAVADKATTLPGTTRSLYAEARDVYGSRAELLDALTAGRAFMRGDSEMTGAAYRAMGTGERRMFRIGIAREVRKALGSKSLSSDALGYFDKPNTRAVLEEIMSPAQAHKFYDLIQLEQAMAATNQAVRGNSRTAERQQNILDFSLGVRLGRAIKTQGLRDALMTEITDQITKAFAMREGDAVVLSRALFDTNRANQRATLQRLVPIYGRTNMRGIVNRAERIARRQVANRRRALAGVVGEMGAETPAQ